MTGAVVLRALGPGDEEAFRTAVAAIAPTFEGFAFYWDEAPDYPSYVRRLEDARRGIGLPIDHVANTLLFGFEGGACVGRVSIRHELNAFLAEIGGHVGYATVPEFRGRGVATAMLRQALAVARDDIGLDRVLLTVDESNAASIRVIEKCGGRFDRMVDAPALSEPKRRYWIAT